MSDRISKVTTRAGDKGKTKLATGKTISKSSQYVATVGAVDELNSHVGVILAELQHAEHSAALIAIQQDLFDMGAVLAMQGEYGAPSAEAVESLTLDCNEALPPLTEFVLPRGSRLVAAIHVTRTVCRRAEAEFWRLIEDEPSDNYMACAQYLNRLSDLFFVLARFHTRDGEEQWRGPSTRS